MELTVLIPIWKRHDLTDICFANLKRQQDKFKFSVVVVGSEGEASKLLADKYGFTYLEFSNEFLGAKLNTGLSLCKGDVVVIGSDDFLSDSAFSYYATIDSDSFIYAGVSPVYFHSTKAKSLSLFVYKGQKFKTVGAGRIYTRATIEACNGELWQHDKQVGLDTSASVICAANGCKEVVTDKFSVLDVKHSHNLTNPNVYRIGEKRKVEEIEKVFGSFVADSIKNLTYSPETIDRIKVRLKPSHMTNNVSRVRLLKDCGKLKAGMTISQPRLRARKLVANGMAEWAESANDAAPAFKEEKVVTKNDKENGNNSVQKPTGKNTGGSKKGK